LLIQANTELPAGVTGCVTEYLARPYMPETLRQVIENSFVLKIELGHEMLFQLDKAEE